MKPGWSCQSKGNGYRKHRWETMKGGDVLNPIIASMIHPGYRVRICLVCGYAMSEKRPKRRKHQGGGNDDLGTSGPT